MFWFCEPFGRLVVVRVLSLLSSLFVLFLTEPWHSPLVLFSLSSACSVSCWSVVFGSRHSCLVQAQVVFVVYFIFCVNKALLPPAIESSLYPFTHPWQLWAEVNQSWIITSYCCSIRPMFSVTCVLNCFLSIVVGHFCLCCFYFLQQIFMLLFTLPCF